MTRCLQRSNQNHAFPTEYAAARCQLFLKTLLLFAGGPMDFRVWSVCKWIHYCQQSQSAGQSETVDLKGNEGPPPGVKVFACILSLLCGIYSIMALCCRFAAAVRSCGGTFRLLQ